MCEKAMIAAGNIRQQEPGIGGFSKRIGSTTYKVSIRFSDKATETLEDKVLRLIEREVSRDA